MSNQDSQHRARVNTGTGVPDDSPLSAVRPLSDDASEGIIEALDNYVRCNCGDPCEGTCTHAKLTRALAQMRVAR